MDKIAIIVDSTCGIPDHYLSEFPIKIVRLKVVYHDAQYIDGIDIQASDVYERLPLELPTTSMPTVEDLYCVYEQLIQDGYTHVIGLPVSSGLSGTINSFRIAAEHYKSQITSCIYDFKHLSMALGLSVLKLGQMIKAGASYTTLVNFLPKLQENTHMYFTVETLDYLIKGGRIGKVSGQLGKFLNLKPIITMDEDGGYKTYSKVRGNKQAFSQLKNLALSFLEKGSCQIAVMTGTMREEAQALCDELAHHPHLSFLHQGELTPVVGIHSGPRILAIAILSEPETN